MPASPRPPAEALETRLRNARRLNVALGALAVFLLLVVFAVRSSDDPADRLSAGAEPAPAGPSTGGGDAADDDGSDPAATDAAPDRSFARDDHPFVIGDPDAPVVLSEWIDLRCPFCAVFTNKTLPILVEDYVDEGLVRIEVHAVSFFGEQSTAGAVALRAAADQDRFVEYLTTLYGAAPDKGHPDHSRDVLIGFARDAGVPDLDAFEVALDDPALHDEVIANTAQAQRLGVQAVPFFVVGDQAISGAQPIEVFRGLLDRSVEDAER